MIKLWLFKREKLNLLLITGDISAIKGENGPFVETLKGLGARFTNIYVFFPEVNQDLDINFAPNIHLRSRKFSFLTAFIFYKRLKNFIQDKKIDLIVAHDYGLMLNGINGIILSKKINIPLISEIFHLEGHPYSTNAQEFFFKYWGMLYIKIIHKHVLKFRVMNDQIIKNLFIILKVPTEKICKLNAVYIRPETFFLKNENKKYDLFYCGRFNANKGILNLLKAVHKISRAYPELKVLMLGRGPLKDDITKFIKDNNLEKNIFLMERVKSERDLAQLYSESKFVVCASSVEGGPRVTIEALCCGTPIITTPVGIMPEIIRPGVNGLISGFEVEELHKTILEGLGLDKKQYESMSKQAPLGLSQFEFENSMKNIYQTYHSAVFSNRPENENSISL